MNEQQEREWEDFLKSDEAWYVNLGQPNFDAMKAHISRLIEEAREEGRNEAVDSISTAMGIEEGKVVEVRPNFLQSLLDALEAARNKN